MSLNLLVPPPLLVVLIGAAMWLIDHYLGANSESLPISKTVAAVLFFMGAVSMCLAGYQFWKHRTTINPMQVQKTTALITSGVYRWSRNPIYLGDMLLLLAWLFWLESWINLIWIAVFMAYVTRFQIIPEEQSLQRKFGEEWNRYRDCVRRWI